MMIAVLALAAGACIMLGTLVRARVDDSKWMADLRWTEINVAAERVGCPCGRPYVTVREYHGTAGRVPRREYRCAEHDGMVAWSRFGSLFEAQWSYPEPCPLGMTRSSSGLIGQPAMLFTCPHSTHEGADL